MKLFLARHHNGAVNILGFIFAASFHLNTAQLKGVHGLRVCRDLMKYTIRPSSLSVHSRSIVITISSSWWSCAASRKKILSVGWTAHVSNYTANQSWVSVCRALSTLRCLGVMFSLSASSFRGISTCKRASFITASQLSSECSIRIPIIQMSWHFCHTT